MDCFVSAAALLGAVIAWYPSYTCGRLLKTQPPTPAFPNHLTHDETFATTLGDKLRRLEDNMRERVRRYGPEISDWLPGHEPPGLKQRLLEEQETREHLEADRVNALSDTNDEEEQERKNRKRLMAARKKRIDSSKKE